MENKENDEYKNRIKKLIERVEKGENSLEAYKQLLEKIEQVKITAIFRTKKRERNEKAIVGFTYAIREYYRLIFDPNYPFNKEDLKKKIDAIYKLIYKEFLKITPYCPDRWDLDNKRRIVENMRKVLGTENVEYFIKKYRIRRLIRLKFEMTKYYKYYVICWTIAFIVLITIFVVQRS
ncbi:MAG: hypothetical protein EAX91_12810 [Candidatus Lokiarchaeota archaeon]|nr:hypothetical protein [Candidatus Lokiarchaeota archaeon]